MGKGRKKLSDLRRKVRETAKSAIADPKAGIESAAGAVVGAGEKLVSTGEHIADSGAHVGAHVASAAAQVGEELVGDAITAGEGIAAAGAEMRRRLREGTRAMLGNVFMPMRGTVLREIGIRPPRDRSGMAPGSYAAEYDEVIEVTVVLRARSAASTPAPGGRRGRGRKSRAELAEQFSADPADIAAVEAFAAEHELTVANTNARQRRVTLSGRVSDMEDAFQLRMSWYEHEFHPHRGFDGEPAIPEELHGVVTAVLGISDRPQANVETPAAAGEVEEVAALTVRDLGRLYGFPDNARGAGQVIAVLLLGGGFYEEDLDEQMKSLGLPVPPVTVVSVDGRGNTPCDVETLDEYVSWINYGTKINGFTIMEALWTVECSQDLQMIAGLAPEAEILVFFTKNTDAGISNALATIRDHPKEPTILSISWSQTERSASDAFLTTFEEELTYLSMAGVTVCCASGDRGSYNGEKVPSVAYPASSPNTLACGATTLSWQNDAIVAETTWNSPLNGYKAATGGGASSRFATPEWQAGCAIPDSGFEGGGRGVPDVVSAGDPSTGCTIYLGSGSVPSAGTSAAAPLWAAFVACVNGQRDDPLGYVTPDLYDIFAKRGGEALRGITDGNNDIDTEAAETWIAGPGWNPCGGLGSPIGTVLFDELVALE